MKNQILLIDNDVAVRDALKKLLHETGYKTVLAADGEQGLECLKQHAFDLLILDLDLPGLTGFDVIDVAMEKFPNLSILVLTGMLDQCEPGALTHVDVVMEKPADVPRLLRTVSTLMNEPELVRMRRLHLSLVPPSAGAGMVWRPEFSTKHTRLSPPGGTVN